MTIQIYLSRQKTVRKGEEEEENDDMGRWIFVDRWGRWKKDDDYDRKGGPRGGYPANSREDLRQRIMRR